MADYYVCACVVYPGMQICSVSIVPSEAFRPLSSRSQPQSSNPQQLIRYDSPERASECRQEVFLNSFLQVVLLLRDSEGRPFGHPLITQLPLEAHGSLYYKTVSSLLPESLANLQWTLCFTEAKVRMVYLISDIHHPIFFVRRGTVRDAHLSHFALAVHSSEAQGQRSN